MRKHWVIILISLMLSHFLFGQQIYFNNRYDYQRNCDGATNVLPITGGYLIATESDTLCSYGRIGLLSIDTLGSIKWWKIYGKGLSNYSVGNSIIISDSDNYVLITQKDSGAVLWKLNNVGDTLWSKTFYDSLYYLEAIQCSKTRDRGFIIEGAAQAKKTGLFSVMVIKTDSLGKEQWSQFYNSSGNDYGYSIDTCSDGGYIIGSGANFPELIKVDSLGKIQWNYSYPIANGLADAIALKEGGYAFACYVGSTALNYGCIRVDDAGKQVWFKQYPPPGNNTGPSAICELKNFDIVIGGQITDSNTVDGALLRIDSSGNLLWYRNYKKLKATNSQNYLRDVKPTSDGGFIACGFCVPSSPDTGTQDVWILKVDSNGCDSIGHCPIVPNAIQEIKPDGRNVVVYPNPSNGIITVSIQGEADKCQIEIYNMLGQSICENKLNLNTTVINLSSQAAGIYLYRIISVEGEYIANGKFVIQ